MNETSSIYHGHLTKIKYLLSFPLPYSEDTNVIYSGLKSSDLFL